MSTELETTSGDALHARMEYAKALAVSDLLPQAYRGKPANVLVAIEYGRALGLEPMAAIQGIVVIQGKPTASAQLVGALVRRAGHRLRVRLVTDDKGHPAAEATVIRSDDPDYEFRAVWTMERAKAANLVSKGGSWQTYPAAMLKARAITEVARDACPEALAGVAYTPEELEPSTRTTVDTSTLTVTPAPVVTVDTVTGVIDDADVVDDAEVLDPGEEG